MRRAALAIGLGLGLLAIPAQAAGIKTATQILAEINQKCPDNNQGLCTPAILRLFITDIVNSYLNAGNNLSDILNAASARNNLGIVSISGTNLFRGVNTFALNTISILPAALPNTIVRAMSADGVLNRLEMDGANNSANFSCVRNDGTMAARSAVLAGEPICAVDAWAFNGSANMGPIGAIHINAAENIGSANQGSYIRFATTPLGSTTLADVAGIENDGGMTAPPTVSGGSKGAGTLNLSGDVYLAGVALEAVSQTLSNKTLASPAITGPATFAAAPIFTGQTGYAFANGSSALSFSATVPLTDLATISADNVVINASGSSAAPTGIILPDCHAAASALTYNQTSHAFACNSIAAGGSVNSGTSAQLAYYASNGVVVSGLTLVPAASGGTGAASLTAHGVALGEGASAMAVVGAPGSSGLCLQSVSGADPIWDVCATGATVTPSYGISVSGTAVKAPLIAISFAHQLGAM